MQMQYNLVFVCVIANAMSVCVNMWVLHTFESVCVKCADAARHVCLPDCAVAHVHVCLCDCADAVFSVRWWSCSKV